MFNKYRTFISPKRTPDLLYPWLLQLFHLVFPIAVSDSSMLLVHQAWTLGVILDFSLLLTPHSAQSLSRVWLFATPWIAARQASLSITNCRSFLKLMPIKSVMPSSHLILCPPLLLLPPIAPSIRVFSNESTLCMRWPPYYPPANPLWLNLQIFPLSSHLSQLPLLPFCWESSLSPTQIIYSDFLLPSFQFLPSWPTLNKTARINSSQG